MTTFEICLSLLVVALLSYAAFLLRQWKSTINLCRTLVADLTVEKAKVEDIGNIADGYADAFDDQAAEIARLAPEVARLEATVKGLRGLLQQIVDVWNLNFEGTDISDEVADIYYVAIAALRETAK